MGLSTNGLDGHPDTHQCTALARTTQSTTITATPTSVIQVKRTARRRASSGSIALLTCIQKYTASLKATLGIANRRSTIRITIERNTLSNGSRLSCGALKKDSFHNLRASSASSAC